MRTALRAVALAIPVLAAGTACGLDFGDRAAPLDVATWVRGDPLDIAKPPTRLTVVLFWATWDSASKKAIPLLNRWQQLHPNDVAIVGVANEEESVVRKCLGETPAVFRIAIDKGADTKKAWMSGITGLPHAFIVDAKGTIAWHGTPQVGLTAALADLRAGTYKPDRFVKLNALRRQLTFTLKARDLPKTLDVFERMIATVPQDAFAHQNRATLLAKQSKMAETRDAYLAMGRSCTSDPDALAEAARRLATTRHLPLRAMAAALGFAQRAAELTDQRDLKILGILARVHYELGHLAKAAEVQARAVRIAPQPDQAPLKALLLFYQSEAQRRAADPDAR